MRRREGGPFGATIVREGQVIAAVGNTMVRDTDPSAHAEMVAVREACQKLGTMDLSDCEIYATCEPCPMCVGVMMWANVKKVYYSSKGKKLRYTVFPTCIFVAILKEQPLSYLIWNMWENVQTVTSSGKFLKI
ncbi:nucleoside deaminase [Lactococcus formosensis]|uniref:nucleoside deaminase n=1 Tax=Lactococcus formosensis TaxID=1281486 RepID=UPI0030CD7F50